MTEILHADPAALDAMDQASYDASSMADKALDEDDTWLASDEDDWSADDDCLNFDEDNPHGGVCPHLNIVATSSDGCDGTCQDCGMDGFPLCDPEYDAAQIVEMLKEYPSAEARQRFFAMLKELVERQ